MLEKKYRSTNTMREKNYRSPNTILEKNFRSPNTMLENIEDKIESGKGYDRDISNEDLNTFVKELVRKVTA